VICENQFPFWLTYPFCQLPLPTLFHWPEVVYFGDSMWLWVRLGVDDTRSSRFSRVVGGTSDTTRMLFQLLDPTFGWAIFRVGKLLNRKYNSSRGPRRHLQTISNLFFLFLIWVIEFQIFFWYNKNRLQEEIKSTNTIRLGKSKI
jgi:hypothetical protein